MIMQLIKYIMIATMATISEETRKSIFAAVLYAMYVILAKL